MQIIYNKSHYYESEIRFPFDQTDTRAIKTGVITLDFYAEKEGSCLYYSRIYEILSPDLTAILRLSGKGYERSIPHETFIETGLSENDICRCIKDSKQDKLYDAPQVKAHSETVRSKSRKRFIELCTDIGGI